MIILRQSAFSSKKEQARGPIFNPTFHIDARDKNGNRIAIPAYIDENGKMKELTEDIWNKYHGKNQKNFSLKNFANRMRNDSLDLKQVELDRQSNNINIRKKLLNREIGLIEAARMRADNNNESIKKRINIRKREQ